MAREVVTTTNYTDDLDGSTATSTVRFSFEGTDYEIDLSKSNLRSFEKAMAVYVGHARKISRRGRPASRRSNGTSRGKQQDLSLIRTWANDNGYSVSQRGRIAADVVDAYNAAH